MLLVADDGVQVVESGLTWVADGLARWPPLSSSRSIRPACQKNKQTKDRKTKKLKACVEHHCYCRPRSFFSFFLSFNFRLLQRSLDSLACSSPSFVVVVVVVVDSFYLLLEPEYELLAFARFKLRPRSAESTQRDRNCADRTFQFEWKERSNEKPEVRRVRSRDSGDDDDERGRRRSCGVLFDK